MPPVKKRAPARRAAPKTSATRKAAQRPRRAAKGSRAKAPAEPSVFVRLGGWLAARARGAAAVGAVGFGLLALLMLLSGGYLADAARRIDIAGQKAAIGAGFAVTQVTVRGRANASDEEILAAVGDVLGASLLHYDVRAARERVEAIGWVRSAAVQRLWPATIHVSVRERAPAAVWQRSGRPRLIDVDGVEIAALSPGARPELPLIVGEGAPDAASRLLKALAGAPEVRKRTAAMIRVGGRRWNVRLTNGADLKLPERDFEASLAEIERLHVLHGTLDQDLLYIDARDPDRLAIRPRTSDESGA